MLFQHSVSTRAGRYLYTLLGNRRLQRVQDAAARLLLGLSRRDHVRPALKELHWLPVVYRIQFKLALVMFTIHTRCRPDYLSDSVQACNSDPARTRLRSASSTDYTIPRTRMKFGNFYIPGPVPSREGITTATY